LTTAGAIAQSTTPSLAQLMPAKPLQIVVANAAGGPADFIARVISPKLSEALRQSVVVDNRPSANGVVAGEFVARAVADGSVIAVGNSGTHAINYSLYKKPTYDPVRDFAAITEVVNGSLVLVAHPRVPANTVRELIAEAKKAPGKINIAIAGATGEVAGNAFKLKAGVDLNNVPYKGGAPAVIAVMAGESQLVLTNLSGVATQVDAGKLKILGVTGARRDPQLPNVPTFAESGLEGYEVEMWYGLFAPAKTPVAIVQALQREVARIVAVPEIRDKFVAGGYEVVATTPEQFTERVKRDTEKYRRIILESGMQQE
jgi:tripartite-type tricarboxylate transporter receptor subunit TctC